MARPPHGPGRPGRLTGLGTKRDPERAFIPALGWKALTRLYDPLLAATMPEERFRSRLLERGGHAASSRVLDLGCGTGSLALFAAHRGTPMRWTGIDADRTALGIAAGKAAREGERLALAQARAGALPFRDAVFDRVFSSLVLHHLTGEEKCRALAETFRVTVPGGEIHVADWGPPRGLYARVAFAVVRLLDGRGTTEDNAAGRLPAMMEAAGFQPFRESERIATMFGTLEFLSARKHRQ